MSRNSIIESVEQAYLKKDVPQFEVGDTVDVAILIKEGEKQRVQVFSGTVIMRKGTGINETFTVRRIVNNEGVERVLPLHSPSIAGVTVRRSGQTRRSRLFYLRDRVGKAVRLTEKRKVKKDSTAPAESSEPGAARERELAASAT